MVQHFVMNVCAFVYLCRIAVSLIHGHTDTDFIVYGIFIEKDFIPMEVEHLQMVSKLFNSVASFKALEFIHKCIIPIQFHQPVCVCARVKLCYC